MGLYARLADRAVQRVPGIGVDERADLAATLHELGTVRPAERWRELLSVVWLRLRLHARLDTGDRPDLTWRQGLRRGGGLLLVAGVVDVLAAALGARDPGDVASTNAFVLRATIGAVAVLAGLAPRREESVLCPWQLAGFVVAATAVAATGATAAVVVVGGLTLAVPLAWLATSRADARLAVAAAVVLFWRLVAVDLHELGDAAVALPTDHELDLLLVRWIVMVAGVAAAVTVARSSMRRAATP